MSGERGGAGQGGVVFGAQDEEQRTWKLAMPLSKPICATGAAARGASAGLTTGASAALNASEGAKAAMASICVENKVDKAGQRGRSG